MDYTSIMELIKLFKQRRWLWDTRHILYKDKIKKDETWTEIAAILAIPVEEAKRKMNILRTQYRREKKRVHDALRIDEKKDVHIKKWFAYDALEFLDRPYASRISSDFPRRIQKLVDSKPQIKTKIIADHSLNIIENVVPEIKEESIDINQDEFHYYLENHGEGLQEDHQSLQNSSACKRVAPEQLTPKRQKTDNFEEDEEVQAVAKAEDEKEECNSFGEHVGFRLRKLSDYARAIAIRNISNILFEADMGIYEKQSCYSTDSTSNTAG